jgi:hypothetical protein
MGMVRLDVSMESSEISLQKDTDLGDMTLSVGIDIEFICTEPQAEIAYRLLQKHFDGRRQKKGVLKERNT